MPELLFNKVTGLKVCNFIKKRLQHRCFLVNIAKFLRTPIFKNICEKAASVLLIIKLVISIRDLFLIKNITWDSF